MNSLLLIGLLMAIEPVELEPLAVSGRDLDHGEPESVARLDASDLATLLPTHPAELFARLPGSWVTRGSGQEHLSAIRSPLLTGAGGCGALLILEDGIPIRPPGFCNVNNLFELNLLQAGAVEIRRGPGGIGHASGGLHGVIDVRTTSALAPRPDSLQVELGAADYRRVAIDQAADLGQGRVRLSANLVDAGSFRVDEGYEHQLLTLRQDGPVGQAWGSHVLSAARLDQDTAGFIVGLDSYRDPVARRANVNPEAFRQATAVRWLSRWQWLGEAGSETRLSAFARRSRMSFLQHFLPGQPLERNGQISAGLQLDWRGPPQPVTLSAGLDGEWFRGFLFQAQEQPTVGPPPVAAIRPQGRHYDYEVDGARVGGYGALETELGPWQLRAGVHLDWIFYDYRTRLAAGNLAEDGSACPGGCLYNRPADRSDNFLDLAPEIHLHRNLGELGTLWWRAAGGFRAPQATELYRLQRGQDVAELDSERLESVELGWRGQAGELAYELVGYAQRKRNFIFRDSEGFNVSDGRTRHVGLEWSVDYSLRPDLNLSARGSLARHQYRFDRDLGGETIRAGNTVVSAPRQLYSADLSWRPTERWLAAVALERTGAYFLDADNTRRYPGHLLWHAYLSHQHASGWSVALRLRNLANRRYAERADFAFGNFRYFPGAGRSAFVQVGYQWR